MMKIGSTPIVLAVITLLAAGFSGLAGATQIISASPGQAITYQGNGAPDSQVTMEVTASISLGVGGDGRYYKDMRGVEIPGGSRFSITASPVDTFSVSGGMHGIGMTIGSVSNHVGSASMGNVPGGTYNIVVTGIANGSGPVSVTVHAYQTKSTGSDGSFTASISTSGLPPAIYSVRQDGVEVATVYLGVDAPVTPTPIPVPTATPTPTPPPNGTITPTSTFVPPPTPAISVSSTPTPKPGGFLGIQLPSLNIFGPPQAQPASTNVSETPQAGGHSSLINTVLIVLIAIVTGLIIGYVVVFVLWKK